MDKFEKLQLSEVESKAFDKTFENKGKPALGFYERLQLSKATDRLSERTKFDVPRPDVDNLLRKLIEGPVVATYVLSEIDLENAGTKFGN